MEEVLINIALNIPEITRDYCTFHKLFFRNIKDFPFQVDSNGNWK